MVMIDKKNGSLMATIRWRGTDSSVCWGSLDLPGLRYYMDKVFFNHYSSGKIMPEDNQKDMKYYNPMTHMMI
jgi:hypothetical protein